jgi:hypothetical protein
VHIRFKAFMPTQPDAGARKRVTFPMRVLLAIRHSAAFSLFMTCVILFNCVSFVLDGRNVSESTRSFMDTSDLVCLIIFTVEIAICVVADGAREYWSSSWNRFDVLVIGLSWIFDFSNLDASLSVFRILRVLRPLRLLKRIGSLQDLLQMYGLSTGAFSSVYLVLALGLLLFAIVALQIFSNVSKTPHVCTRQISGSPVPLIAPHSFSLRDHVTCRPSEGSSWWDQRCGDSECRPSALLSPEFQSTSSISRSSFDSFGPAIFTVYVRCIFLQYVIVTV